MSRINKLVSAAIAVVVTATIVGIVAYDRGRTAPQKRPIRVNPTSGVADVSWAQPARNRPGPAPNTVIELVPRPSCHYLAWRAVTAR